MIKIKAMAMDTWWVEVNGATTTEHEVTLAPDYYTKLTGGAVSEETLIEKSFEFLLERESNTSILAKFELPVISRYFPEYEEEIARKIS